MKLINSQRRKILKRNILRATVAASIFGLSGAAFAESVDVPFSGTVPGTCSITKTSDGVLGLAASPTLTSDEGSRGVIEVTCTGGNGILDIGYPYPTGSTPFPNTVYASIYDAATVGNFIVNQQVGGEYTMSPGTNTYYVSMAAVRDSGWNPGTYTFEVEVTITPQ